MTRFDIDRGIAALARSQHGAFHRAQVQALGGDDSYIRRRLVNGSWVRLDRAVFALASHPGTWLRQAKAAELSLPDAALSGRSAAVLHGLTGFRPGALELTVAPSCRGSSRLATVRRREDLPTCRVSGIHVVSLAQTVCDVAASSTQTVLDRAVDDLLVARRLRVEELAQRHAALLPRRSHGIGRVSHLLAEVSQEGYVPTESELEASLRSVLRDSRLPDAVPQAAFPWWPDGACRVDFFIPSWRRILEADGRRWHTRRADFERDAARDHLAQRHGYEVTRFTYRHLVDDRAYVVDVLLDIGRHVEVARSVA
ncbi:MAG: endonuclease domain-containing protein [Acidimicrobiales bacterium]|jgi:very-short-patch-repair endonuclease|nr:endonuclease domain-containing protein [Acidimicrobiales bacterium]